ncbi:unnamed protein product [Spirodela intermedia]|uniref:Uncharacterized protein n=1 Tax=Spirodela intermedia TaxID=51605 RepID=A0A7I8J769_SPIIN|nr:unnamed protein product [Spirodela intermedia]CAA6665575.1 unnamed protein product [Spirodela intermedia]
MLRRLGKPIPPPVPLSSLLPVTLNPSNTAVELICCRLKQLPATSTAPLLSPADHHLLPTSDPARSAGSSSALSPAPSPPSELLPPRPHPRRRRDIPPAMAVLSELVLTHSAAAPCDVFDGLAGGAEGCNGHPAVFGMLVKVYVKLGRLDQALEVFRRTTAACLPVDSANVNCLLNGLSKVNRRGACWEVYGEMKSAGIPANSYTFNILTGVLCKGGDVGKSTEFLEEMEEAGFNPDVVTYNTIIDGFCRKGRTEEALYLYRIMYRRGVEPDLITYTVLIAGLGREGKIKEAHQLFDRMCHRGLNPDCHAYNALISGYCKVGKAREGRVLLQEMIQSGLKPDGFTFRALWEGYRRGGKLLAFLNLVVQLRSSGGSSVSSETYRTLMAALCEGKRPNAARSLFGLFLEDGYEPDSQAFNLLIEGFCGCDCLTEALELVEEMTARGLAPDSATYTPLVRCLCRQRKVKEAEWLMRKMMGAGLAPTSAICLALVEGHCKERAFSEAERLLSELTEEFQIYDPKSYNLLIEAYSAEGDARRSFELQDKMIRLGVTPNTQTCRLLINGLLKPGIVVNVQPPQRNCAVTTLFYSILRNTNETLSLSPRVLVKTGTPTLSGFEDNFPGFQEAGAQAGPLTLAVSGHGNSHQRLPSGQS